MAIHSRSSTITKGSRKTVPGVIAMAAEVANAAASAVAGADLHVVVVEDLPAVETADSVRVVVVKADHRVPDSAMTGVIAEDLTGTRTADRALKPRP